MGVAFVGSSNLSRSALDTGVEWNLRVERDRDARAYRRIREAFERTWDGARVLDSAWIQLYADRARAAAHQLPTGDAEAEPVEGPPEPHAVQREALGALAAARASGRRRALVILATGLGKTWLAAFDYQQLRAEGASGPRPRLLFLAHRRELLRQAATTYRRLTRSVDPRARVGWFTDQDDDLAADLVFASAAKLARKEHLAKLGAQRFDYVVVDEVHHAAADSYRRILAVLAPRFLLGLTATPDRADDGDIMGLFDDFVAYRADIATGVALREKTQGSVGLVPFRYFGVKDDIDYEHIPWRNRRFDADAVAEAAQTEARMETLWRAWEAHPGRRSLVFCCSIAHAKYVRAWLTERGLRVRAVFSGEGSDSRDEALAAFERGELDALCAVDVFNEGVDVPSIDRVVMLRPTESSVVFLQQLGRGLRASPTKDHVTVVDFVGNHRVFLERVRTLLSLAGGAAARSLRGFLQAEGEAQLPAGCSVELELEAKELLTKLFRVGGADEVERAYRELRIETGGRPTAGQLQRMGYLPSRLRERHGSWLEFVLGEGDLDEDEKRAVDVASGFLREVETTEMTKCFKMVTLLALLDADAFGAGLSVRDLAVRSHALLRRSPELYEDVAEAERAEALEGRREPAWIAYWRKNPIAAWTADKRDRRTWFRVAEGDRFVLDLGAGAPLPQALPALARELVDYRLAQYRARKRQGTSPDGFVCKVTWNQRDPILKVPRQPGVDLLPRGETDVRLPNGSVWQFRFAKEFCNVARPAGTQHNQLPELLIRWFGPRAGQLGTAFEVRFHASPDGLWAEPVQATIHELAARRGVVAYPDLRAAAGHALGAVEAPEGDAVLLPIDLEGADLFAVRVAGTSMDGGREPLRDGDWAVMRAARSAPGSALADRVVLVQVPGESFGSQYQIKRLRRRDQGWLLTSDNPAGPTIEPGEDMAVVARLERVVHAEELGPAVGTLIAEAQLADRFGLERLEARSGREGGHLFVFIAAKGVLEAPDRLRYVSSLQRPGETAFVLAQRSDGSWRYCGVARQVDGDGSWSLPAVDYPTWRTWGEGREVSRRLPDGALARAQIGVDALLALGEDERWIVQADGRRARVLGGAPRGGLRIDGSEGGFAERTVSLHDIGWVIAAADDVERTGGALDEERVNGLRYLESTPKGSTRWIDTRWALAAWNIASGLVREPIAGERTLARVHDANGKELDASFRVERVGDALTVVVESRGGTRGTAAERNFDYTAGLELILERIGAAGLKIADVLVESRDTARLAAEERRVVVDGQQYPMVVVNAVALRQKISAAQARVGRADGALGSGNRTRRLRLFVADASTVGGVDELVRRLARDSPDPGAC